MSNPAFRAITSKMDAFKWADDNGYRYHRQRIGFSVYYNPSDVTVIEIGDEYCAIYRHSARGGSKTDRLLHKRTYA